MRTAPVILGNAVNPQGFKIPDEVSGWGFECDHLDMQVRESGFPGFFPEIIQGNPGFFDASKTFHQVVDTEYGENRATVNFIIVGLFKILFYHPFNDYFEIFPVHSTAPHYCGIIGKLVYIPVVPPDVMVRPHKVKLHFVIVFGFQEAIV